MASDPLERLISLVRRELGADDVRVLEGPMPAVAAPNVIHANLADGRKLAVAFAATPAAREALVRRLDMLLVTFAQSIEEDPSVRREPRASAVQSLQEELRALAARAQAVDAVVIDAHSPVIWGSAMKGRPVRHDLGNVELVECRGTSSWSRVGLPLEPTPSPTKKLPPRRRRALPQR